MNYLDIKTLDIANGPGCRISLFVSGCRRHCKECFNPESWDFNNGELFTEDTAQKIIDLLKPEYIDGFTILGGEPFEVENRPVLHVFLRQLREEYPELNIWIYTGYKLEELLAMDDMTREIISMIDILVDGPFQIDKKDISLQYCGSTNQRVIDVQSTLKNRRIICHDQYNFGNKGGD